MGHITPENIIIKMLDIKENWEDIERFCMIILSAERKEINKQN